MTPLTRAVVPTPAIILLRVLILCREKVDVESCGITGSVSVVTEKAVVSASGTESSTILRRSCFFPNGPPPDEIPRPPRCDLL